MFKPPIQIKKPAAETSACHKIERMHMHKHNQETIKSVLSFSLNECDFTNPESIERYAKQLEDMTFQEVIDLGIAPGGIEREYDKKGYKGGMGTLIEERFFGYKANNEQEADFPEAGVELKASPLNMKRRGLLCWRTPRSHHDSLR